MKKVLLFVPCLIDQVYPEMGIAAYGVLRHLGFEVEYDSEITCCGQPAFNAGHKDEACRVAEQSYARIQSVDAVVLPSGSCTAMIRNFYPGLITSKPQSEVAQSTKRVFEFCEFVLAHGDTSKVRGDGSRSVAFHNSCHALRELGLKDEGARLVREAAGPGFISEQSEPVCCGFGGLFSVKFSAIAGSMACTRLESFVARNVETLVSNDPGCIMHMRQEAKARAMKIEILHVTEFLARTLSLPKTLKELHV